MRTAKPKVAKKQVTYLIPQTLERAVRVAAAEQGIWPANYVAELLAAHFARKAKRAEVETADSPN